MADQRRDCDRRARGEIGTLEEFLVHFVPFVEILHVGQETRDFHDVAELVAGSFEDIGLMLSASRTSSVNVSGNFPSASRPIWPERYNVSPTSTASLNKRLGLSFTLMTFRCAASEVAATARSRKTVRARNMIDPPWDMLSILSAFICVHLRLSAVAFSDGRQWYDFSRWNVKRLK